MGDQEKITLELNREHFPQLLARYSLEKIRDMAIHMALKQYRERPVTKAMLHSCLANLEIDLERMFPGEKTPEEIAKDEAEAAEEKAMYQEAIAEMEPYLVDGEQLQVDENGEVAKEGGYAYPVWKTQYGKLMARVYNSGWDWLYLENLEDEEDD